MKDVPFYPNHEDGMRCMLAAYRSIIAHFLHRELTWGELEALTGYKPGRAAWTVKALVDMQSMGLDIRMVEPFDYPRYSKEGEPYLRELYSPEEVKWYYEKSNIRDIKPFIPAFLQHIKYECRQAKLADIDAMLDEGRLVFVTVDASVLNNLDGFASHALLITDRRDDGYIAHDSGGKRVAPQPDRHVTKKQLWQAMGGDENTAEVTGFKLSTSRQGKRLDVYVSELHPDLSRASATKLIDLGKVLVNNSPRKSSYKLHEADHVVVNYDADEAKKIPDIDLPILYEDNDCIVINKPTGVLTHSKGAFNPEATVASFLSSRIGNGMDGSRAGIVHRLDRATSGVIICAKNPEALSLLQKQFSQRKVKKTYMAIVAGKLDPEHAVIDMPIERNPKAPATFRVGANGKSAVTEYEVEQSSAKYSLVKLMPTTGRTHQLRVHLLQLKHPIIGDVIYGGESADRLFLHALSLEITLPNRERKVFTAPLPLEFNQKMEQA